MCTVRLATADDVPTILAISNDAATRTAANFAIEPESLASWERSFATEHATYPWFVAVNGAGEVIGFAKALPWKGRCAYTYSCEVSVYVAPVHHGEGIGTALYEALFETLVKQGYHSVLAGITIPNPASVRLHEAFGMTRVAFFTAIGWKFGRWHDVGYWQRTLQPPGTVPGDIRPVREVVEPD
jgi:phosphinothricin acetyltransferase